MHVVVLDPVDERIVHREARRPTFTGGSRLRSPDGPHVAAVAVCREDAACTAEVAVVGPVDALIVERDSPGMRPIAGERRARPTRSWYPEHASGGEVVHREVETIPTGSNAP